MSTGNSGVHGKQIVYFEVSASTDTVNMGFLTTRINLEPPNRRANKRNRSRAINLDGVTVYSLLVQCHVASTSPPPHRVLSQLASSPPPGIHNAWTHAPTHAPTHAFKQMFTSQLYILITLPDHALPLIFCMHRWDVPELQKGKYCVCKKTFFFSKYETRVVIHRGEGGWQTARLKLNFSLTGSMLIPNKSGYKLV